MMNTVYIEVDGLRLDITEDFGINYAIEDILDISKTRTSYSRTIIINGTTEVNKFFKHIYEVNINTLFFNPKLSAKDVVIRAGDNEVLRGSMQLLDIVNTNGEIQYKVSVRGNLSDIVGLLADYNLDILDLSEYNHNRNKESIKDSFTFKIYKNGQLTQSQIGDGYVYPYIIKELPTNENNRETYIYNLFPSVYIKTIWDKIMQFAGYTYTSEFLNSTYFKQLIFPFVQDKIQLSDEDVSLRTTTVGVDGSAPEYTGGPATGYASLTGILLHNAPDWYVNSQFNYPMRLLRESGQVGETDFQNPQNQWQQYGGWTCLQNGFYDIDIDLQLVAKYFNYNGGGYDIRFNGSGNYWWYYGIRKITNNNQTVVLYQTPNGNPLSFAPSNDAWHSSPWYDQQGAFSLNRTLKNVWLEEGEKIVILFAAQLVNNGISWQIDGMANNNNNVGARITAKESLDGRPSYLTIKPSDNGSYGNEDINMNSILPNNIKLKDFFVNIVKTFNLVIQDDKNQKNNLIIEPRDDFYASKTKVRNWSSDYIEGAEPENKLDRDSEVVLTPLSQVDFKLYRMTYKDDRDYFNQRYTNDTGKVYGDLVINIDNDFSQKEEKLELMFSPSPMSDYLIERRVAPFFSKSETPGEFLPQNVRPRLLFYGGLTFNPDFPLETQSIILRDGATDDEPVPIFGYPYAGHWDNIVNPQNDLVFKNPEKIYFNTSKYPARNLFTTFHAQTLKSIIDKNAMLLEGWFYLTPKDIATFDFRDIIYLDGQYWRVNEIEDYNPVAGENLTKVQLYKIIDYDSSISDQNRRIPNSNRVCPRDIILVQIGSAYSYQSLSGQYVSEECCDSLGGEFIDGRCYISRLDPDFERSSQSNDGSGIINNPGGLYQGFRVIGSSSEVPTLEPVPQQSTANRNSINAAGNLISGKSNYVAEGSKNSLILGDNNALTDGVKSVLILGDNIGATDSGAIYLQNAKINPDGTIVSRGLKIIDGNDNILKTNAIDVIDGGKDSVRNIGGQSKARIIIDGNDFTSETDNTIQN